MVGAPLPQLMTIFPLTCPSPDSQPEYGLCDVIITVTEGAEEPTSTPSSISSPVTSTSTSPPVTSTSTSPPTLGRKPVVGDFFYVGCQTEGDGVRTLPAATHADDDMTLEMCAAFCNSYNFFGVEYGRECKTPFRPSS